MSVFCCETVWLFHIYTINPTLCVHPNLSYLITLLRESLRSTNPEYSYFSAGILANLLCDVHNPAWSDKHTLFHHVQDEMVSTVFKIFARCRSQLNFCLFNKKKSAIFAHLNAQIHWMVLNAFYGCLIDASFVRLSFKKVIVNEQNHALECSEH